MKRKYRPMNPRERFIMSLIFVALFLYLMALVVLPMTMRGWL